MARFSRKKLDAVQRLRLEQGVSVVLVILVGLMVWAFRSGLFAAAGSAGL